MVAANDFVFENVLEAEESVSPNDRQRLGAAAAEGEEETLPALRAFAPETAHETEPDKMTYPRQRRVQMDVLVLVMAMEPGRRTYFHAALVQVDDPPCTVVIGYAMEPGTYHHANSL